MRRIRRGNRWEVLGRIKQKIIIKNDKVFCRREKEFVINVKSGLVYVNKSENFLKRKFILLKC